MLRVRFRPERGPACPTFPMLGLPKLRSIIQKNTIIFTNVTYPQSRPSGLPFLLRGSAKVLSEMIGFSAAVSRLFLNSRVYCTMVLHDIAISSPSIFSVCFGAPWGSF